ncbi:molybdenum cofactor biosynthesis protein B [Vibrio sp.]|uniref:Molybdenum cofactor biosynthesis protein B n=1 Tax=Vibrio viridaestus TaxID=2487322 RepID=A0A3N9TCC5_9VIBR|nr:molybdenum cofactor biosynthesis protein B [Vibrio viridaestus]MDC0611445.1 molybdenum cofactor biosynthesis protein B [Vibrio sp.]RQW61858.1 molybdenum cofactor biosynthesis protein B [Vibrio viridaestus]
MSDHSAKEFQPLNIAVLTVSDTREESTDTSGQALITGLTEAGHVLNERRIVKDDIYQIRAIVSTWIASEDVQAILITGGTGFTSRDTTPEAVSPLFDTSIPGFGEVFRAISLQQIGTSTIQSRAIAGLANGVVIFAMPGSTNACKTAWYDVIQEQLDSTHRPCNFVPHLKKSTTELCATRG